MNLYEQLLEMGLQETDFGPDGPVVLQDDSDGKGPYIAKWESDKPIPKGFTVGKA